MTMLGPCEQCASRVRALLDGEGFQITGFSAAGVCDRGMEEMIGQGFFQGVIDLAPGGVGEHLFGFMRDAGPWQRPRSRFSPPYPRRPASPAAGKRR